MVVTPTSRVRVVFSTLQRLDDLVDVCRGGKKYDATKVATTRIRPLVFPNDQGSDHVTNTPHSTLPARSRAGYLLPLDPPATVQRLPLLSLPFSNSLNLRQLESFHKVDTASHSCSLYPSFPHSALMSIISPKVLHAFKEPPMAKRRSARDGQATHRAGGERGRRSVMMDEVIEAIGCRVWAEVAVMKGGGGKGCEKNRTTFLISQPVLPLRSSPSDSSPFPTAIEI